MTLHRLVLLRHAKAEPAGVVVDHERPLALVGRRQASAVGAALAAAGLAPTHVLCSSALRTRQTWEIARTALGAAGATAPVVSVTDDLYDASTGDLAAILQSLPEEASTVLVVGHEPTMSQAAGALAGDASDEAVLARVRGGVPTAAWTVLEGDGAWDLVAPGALRLVRLEVPA
ncbi:SixA phosphatase family protein [Cellulomonas dongxiuzhuiae]|uniref:SixA phosphatase family protein n=1 Tax=Cellulomonas dongxiuzhuiae TaxID=2819979 RepID=UPI001AAEC4C8|nr:histidine phosphatase family protein [Cellulomonas dongxiuzhuiae]MBO3087356.1 histidine phosphatase family protein [Cellulomonas dongxiuzhuiae]